ncbi:hypothetical protein AK88_05672, partial [Plasmodium fragile]
MQETLWKDMETVLRDFVRHIDSTRHILDALAKSCENTGWDYKENDTTLYKGHTVGDVLKCRFITGALYFMQDWQGAAGTGAGQRHPNDDHFAGIMKCILVHVFARLLSESTCGDSRGTRYAWKTIDKMQMPGGFQGSTSGGKCKRNQYGDMHIGTAQLKAAVEAWLRNNRTVAQQLAHIRPHTACNRTWQKNMRIGEPVDEEDAKKEQVTQGLHIEGAWTDVVKTVFNTIANAGDTFKQHLRERKRKANDSGAVMNVPSTADDNDDSEDHEDEEEHKKTKPSGGSKHTPAKSSPGDGSVADQEPAKPAATEPATQTEPT